MQSYDIIIIGFGKGGKTLAADMGSRGKKVAVIEKSDKMYGGTCINVGCIPTKSLVISAQKVKELEIESFSQKAELYSKAVEEKDHITTLLRGKNFDKLNNNSNITVIHGFASFTGPHTIQVKTDNGLLELKGEKIFMNTGATPVIPKIEGVQESKQVFTSSTLMDLKQLPKKLVIIGGGYIGLEYASFYTNFGSKVTIIQDGNNFIPREDEDISEEIKKVFEKRGVSFLFGVSTKRILDIDNTAIIEYEKEGKQEQIQADAILIATGRRPNIDGLELEKAGIQKTEKGAVLVDEYLRTTVENVWALGDVTGGLQHTYISLDDYRIVKHQLLNDGISYTTKDRKNVPYSVFIEPSYARVGLNEKEARREGYCIKIARLAVGAIPKSQLLHETDGILKVVIDEKTNKILGAMFFCPEAHEMINLIKLAMDASLPYTFLRDQIYTHPTMTESLNDLFAMVQ